MKYIEININTIKELTMERYKFLEKDEKLYILEKSLAQEETLDITHIFKIKHKEV